MKELRVIIIKREKARKSSQIRTDNSSVSERKVFGTQSPAYDLSTELYYTISLKRSTYIRTKYIHIRKERKK